MNGDNPVLPGCCFPNARQCTATSKRTKRRCRAPAAKDKNVCRFHGARAGAPRGQRHGRYKHGHYTLEAKAERQVMRELLQESREVLGVVSKAVD